MATTDNLILGSAKIFVAAAGTSFDPTTDFDAATWDLDASVAATWTDLGHTTSGVTLTNSPEFVKATSQQAARALDVGISEVTTTLTTTLRELDADRLAEIVGGNKGKVGKFAVLMFGPGPEDKPLFFSAPRAYYSGDRSVTLGNDEFASTEVEIEVLDSGSGAAPFSVVVHTPA